MTSLGRSTLPDMAFVESAESIEPLHPPFSENAGSAQQTACRANATDQHDTSQDSTHLSAANSPSCLQTSLSTRVFRYTLPIVFQDRRYAIQMVSEDLTGFLKADLDVSRLDMIEKRLWMAGLPIPARPLHRQAMMSRSIVVSEQADLHLTWSDHEIFIKPFPAYLLDHDFWKAHLCEDMQLYRNACGFVSSYITLISREVDFHLAKASTGGTDLLPHDLSWAAWMTFVSSFCENRDLLTLSPRYRFGELRLGRINLIYRFAPEFRFKHTLRGFRFGYHTYDEFFRRNLAWLVGIFVYLSIIPSVMQVGLSTKALKDSEAFNAAAYGFSVAVLLTPVIVIGGLVAILLLHFFSNFFMAIGKKAKTSEKNRGAARSQGDV